jgi:hypothetical protein
MLRYTCIAGLVLFPQVHLLSTPHTHTLCRPQCETPSCTFTHNKCVVLDQSRTNIYHVQLYRLRNSITVTSVVVKV